MDLSYGSEYLKRFWSKNIPHFKIELFKKGSLKGKTDCVCCYLDPSWDILETGEREGSKLLSRMLSRITFICVLNPIYKLSHS